MKKVINEIIDSLSSIIKKKSTRIIFSDSDYEPVDFDKRHFHEIKTASSERKIAFIDGGNAPIIETPGFCVHLIRLCAAFFISNKKIKTIGTEFFVLVSMAKTDNPSFSVKVFPNSNHENTIGIDLNDLEFSILDPTLRSGGQQVRISSVANAARRFGELIFARAVVEALHRGDVLVLDGSLLAKVTNEKKYLDILFSAAEKQGIMVTGLSKTTQMITDSGEPAPTAIAKLTDLERWYYYPVAKSKNQVDIFIAKLHKMSRFAFRFDLYNTLHKAKQDTDELFAVIASNSTDPVFLGYPYGLIYADRHARVSNSEKQYLKTIFCSKFEIEKFESAINAHDILDSIT
jgi:hypothetical protein